MTTHFCIGSPCATCGRQWTLALPDVQIVWNPVDDGRTYRLHNGLCTCQGWLNPHPFHNGPLENGYVGRHRKEP